MRIERIKVPKMVEGKDLEWALGYESKEYYLKSNAKYFGVRYGLLTTVRTYQEDGKRGAQWLLLQCDCGKYCSTTFSKKFKEDGLLVDNCGCILEKQIEEVREEFNTKFKESSTHSQYCSYCESYREPNKFQGEGSRSRYCNCCDYISCYKVKIGSTFDEVISSWDRSSHHLGTNRLPYLSGNVGKGFKVKGFTYVSSEDYETLVKVLWIFCKGYAKTTYSKDNLRRLGREEEYLPLKERGYKPQRAIHRDILDLPDFDKRVGDHIKGLTLDNRRSNLRVADTALNSRNSKKTNSETSSKYKGVTLKSTYRNKPYQAQYSYEGVYRSLKYHFTEEEAALAYDEHLRSLNLEGSLFNFPREGEASVFR